VDIVIARRPKADVAISYPSKDIACSGAKTPYDDANSFDLDRVAVENRTSDNKPVILAGKFLQKTPTPHASTKGSGLGDAEGERRGNTPNPP